MKIRSNLDITRGISVGTFVSHKIQNLGNIQGSVNVDFNNGSQVSCTLTADTTLTFSNAVAGSRYVFYITTNDHAVTMPANVVDVKAFEYFILDYDGTIFHCSSGTFENVIEGTHSELSSLTSQGKLLVGQRYLIADYATKYVQPYSSIVKTGSVEPLILTANSVSSFAKLALSSTYSDDIVYYDFDNILCEDGSTPRNGYIFRRVDSVRNVDVSCDFRTVLLARDPLDLSLSAYSGSFVEYPIVPVLSENVFIGKSESVPNVLILEGSEITVDSECNNLTIDANNLYVKSNTVDIVIESVLTVPKTVYQNSTGAARMTYVDDFDNFTILDLV